MRCQGGLSAKGAWVVERRLGAAEPSISGGLYRLQGEAIRFYSGNRGADASADCWRDLPALALATLAGMCADG